MSEGLRKRLVVYDNGEQILISDDPSRSMTISVQPEQETIAADYLLDVTEQEFVIMAEQAKTNSVDIDTITVSMNEQQTEDEQESNDVNISQL